MKVSLPILLMAFMPGLIYSQDLNYHDYFPVDTVFFEYNNIPFQIQPTTENCWQVGRPSKTNFTNAYSPPLAIVTDTLNPYPVNSNSSFSFVIPYNLVQYSFTTYFQFYHKYDTDTIQDFGTIEASYNGGSTWEVLKDSMCPNWSCVQLYWDDDYVIANGELLPHLLNPSGKSQGWIRSRFIWWWWMPVDGNPAPPPSDSIVVRFTFHSDANPTAKDGWMIDNILIGWRDEGTGMAQLNQKAFLKIVPNPLTDKSKVVCALPGANFDFYVYDLYGRLLYTRKSQPNNPIILSRESFLPGIYLWKSVSNGVVNQSGKLIVY